MDATAFLSVEPAPAILFARAEQHGARPRYMLPKPGGGWVPLSWAEHAEAAKAIGRALIERGLEPIDRVAIFAGNSPQWIEAALGAQAAGLVVVPVYPASTSEQAAYVVSHSDARVLFVAGEGLVTRVLESAGAFDKLEAVVVVDGADPMAALEHIPETSRPSPRWVEETFVHWSTLLREGSEPSSGDPDPLHARLAAIDLDQPALMLYTSGTTGAPKGVPLSHRNVAVNGRDWVECNAPGLPNNGVDLLWLPMSHVFGFGEACLGNNLGFTSYLCAPKDVLTVMPEVRPSVFMSVPAYWEKLAATSISETDDAVAKARLSEATGDRLQFCLSGGAGLGIAVKQHYERCGVVVLEGYGLTECSPTLTLNRPGDYRFDSVGKPLPSVEVRLADDGEILARGPSVFAGYHKNPEATREAFTPDGWFQTGDIGRWTDDGFLRIVDRKKEILVTAGGKNVPPGNIERLFSAEPLLEHVIVYGDGHKYLVAGVWLAEDASEGDDARIELVQAAVDRANAQLARFEQIKRFVLMDRPLTVANGLLTSTLKVRRKLVYAAFADEFEALYR